MYSITCDGKPLKTAENSEAALVSGSLGAERGRIASGSLAIAKTHPYYSVPKPITSKIEITDGERIVFRGRVTGVETDSYATKKMAIESELAVMRDSVSPPHSFPKEVSARADYKEAERNGTLVEYYLSEVIKEHNEQLGEEGSFRVGRVSVRAQSELVRESEEYKSTWERLEEWFTGSELGGQLSVRYEPDGNYVDYIDETEEENEQKIEYGKNLIDIKKEELGEEVYTAAVPIGSDGITAEDMKDVTADVTISLLYPDIKRSGAMLISRSGAEKYGIKTAPITETTWSEITDANELVQKGASYLAAHSSGAEISVTATALDWHLADPTVPPIDINKRVRIISAPHGVNALYYPQKLELDLTHPENSRITVGQSGVRLTELESKRTSALAKLLSLYRAKNKETSESIAQSYALKSDLDALKDELDALKSKIEADS